MDFDGPREEREESSRIPRQYAAGYLEEEIERRKREELERLR